MGLTCIIDSTYHKLVDQILPLSHHYGNVRQYVTANDQFEAGYVAHALCAAINIILKVLHPLPSSSRSKQDYAIYTKRVSRSALNEITSRIGRL